MDNKPSSYELLLSENEQLKAKVRQLEIELQKFASNHNSTEASYNTEDIQKITTLSQEQIARYGRHLLIPEFGVKDNG